MKEYVLGIEATIEIFGGKWKTLIKNTAKK